MNIGDLVTRASHGHDVIFRIVKIDKGIAFLSGEVIRLSCDSPVSDLVMLEEKTLVKMTLPDIFETRNAEKLRTGLILHIDGDELYLRRALGAYRSYGIEAIGYHISEDKIPTYVESLLKKHRPDIVVLTGHDSLSYRGVVTEMSSYRNSQYFAEATKIARAYNCDLDSLVIIAGACQSYYEALIEAGANFASSPKRNNIHLLDPVIVASQIASSRVSEYAQIEKILSRTISKEMGGVDTRGKARKLFLGGN